MSSTRGAGTAAVTTPLQGGSCCRCRAFPCLWEWVSLGDSVLAAGSMKQQLHLSSGPLWHLTVQGRVSQKWELCFSHSQTLSGWICHSQLILCEFSQTHKSFLFFFLLFLICTFDSRINMYSNELQSRIGLRTCSSYWNHSLTGSDSFCFLFFQPAHTPEYFPCIWVCIGKLPSQAGYSHLPDSWF